MQTFQEEPQWWMRLNSEERREREDHQVELTVIRCGCNYNEWSGFPPPVITGLALIFKIIKRRFQGLIILFTSSNLDKLKIMFGIARQQSDRTFLCIVFDLIRLGIVFQYYIWSQRVTCSELSEPAEKTNSQSNEARASELIWAAAGRLTARDSSDHGEWRDGATEGLAGLEGLSAGHTALPQSRPDPSLLLRPNIRGARLGRDSPGEFIMLYLLST